MKNNRKIEVGQVRMYACRGDDSCWENSMYLVQKIEGNYVNIQFITGNEKGVQHCWLKQYLEDDVVVM